MLIQLILFLSLIALSALFSSTETAFTSLTLYQAEELEEKKGRRGKWVAHLARKPDMLLTTLLIGNNLVNIGATALATSLTIELIGNEFIGYTTGLLTLIVLIFCEVTPKQIALVVNDKICLRMAGPIVIMSIIFRPFIWLISGISGLLTRLFTSGKKDKFTLDNLLRLVQMGKSMGIVEDYENQMVKNVFRINDTPVKAIMTHRTELFCLNKDERAIDVINDILKEGHTRIPLFKNDPDHIVGILLLKELQRELILKGDDKDSLRLRDLMVTPLFVPETKMVNDLWGEFKKHNLNIAVVIDEYGGVSGVVSQHDVVEEIFGEISDEDENEDDILIEKISENVWILKGETDFYDIQDILGLELEHDKQIQTIAGYITEKMGEIPEVGSFVQLEEGTYTILAVENNRITDIEFAAKKKND